MSFILLAFSLLPIQAQTSQDTTAVDSNSKLIEFLSAESYNIKKIDSSMDFLILVGHVKIKQGKTLLFGDSIILNTTKNILEGFGQCTYQ